MEASRHEVPDMNTLKLALWGLLGALLVLGAGWLWGASGRWDAQSALQDAQQRFWLADARGALAQARVDLFELNYGQASRHLQQARDVLNEAARRLESGSGQAPADGIKEALARTIEAQQLAASVNTSANERAAEALKALDRATGSTAPAPK
jgi:hypothetical protein